MYEFVFAVNQTELNRRYSHYLKFSYSTLNSKEQNEYIVQCTDCRRRLDKRHALYYSNADGSLDYYCPVCV